MKTYNGKSITKKAIKAVLRTQDPTAIYRLYHQLYGIIPDRMHVYHFIRNYAPSMKVYRKAYWLTFPNKHAMERHDIETACIRKHGFWKGNERKHVVDMLKRECQDVTSNYAKRPMMGHTGLYFCSPVYGHQDYNKRRMMDVKGNERFCELVIKYGDKHFSPVYDK